MSESISITSIAITADHLGRHERAGLRSAMRRGGKWRFVITPHQFQPNVDAIVELEDIPARFLEPLRGHKFTLVLLNEPRSGITFPLAAVLNSGKEFPVPKKERCALALIAANLEHLVAKFSNSELKQGSICMEADMEALEFMTAEE
jgi:hypothetical protein